MTELSESGGLCGAIRHAATGAPSWLGHCHCANCRRATGAPLVTYAGFPTERFSYQAGEPARFPSSPGVTRRFRGRCGTPLTFKGERWPGEVHVMVGTFDRPEIVTPKRHVFTEEKLPWLHLAGMDDDV